MKQRQTDGAEVRPELRPADQCGRCSGTGTIERSAVAGGPFPTCPACNGSGRIRPAAPSSHECDGPACETCREYRETHETYAITMSARPAGALGVFELRTFYVTGPAGCNDWRELRELLDVQPWRHRWEFNHMTCVRGGDGRNLVIAL